jgi:hypothetical protein
MNFASTNPTVSERTSRFVLSFRAIITLVIIVYALLAVVPIAPHFGWRGVHTLATLSGILLFTFALRGRVPLQSWFLPISLVVIILSSATAFHWLDPRYIFASIFLIFALFLLQLADSRVTYNFITVASVFLLIVLVGAWVGFLVAMLGAPPVFEFPNVDGRPNYLYYTTLSNHVWGKIIRPAGIYDEPGTLSFIVCAIAALRHLTDRDSRLTWLLLGLGFITLSLAHLIYVVLHALAEPLRAKNLRRIAIVTLPLIVIAGFFGGFEILNDRLIQRLTFTETGTIVGDDRSWRMVNAVEHLKEKPIAILVGAHPACRFDMETCKQLFPPMGENPLGPLVHQGILISWPYYVVVLFLLLSPLRGRRYLVSFAFGLLLLQRPNLLVIGFSLIGLLVLREAYFHNRAAIVKNHVG